MMGSGGLDLQTTAKLAGWGTPAASDAKGASQPGQRRGQLSEMQCPGPTAESSNAETASCE